MFKVGDIIIAPKNSFSSFLAKVTKVRSESRIDIVILDPLENRWVKVGQNYSNEPSEFYTLYQKVSKGHPLTKLFK